MVEGTFARVFKSGVRPVEIGRRLVREMEKPPEWMQALSEEDQRTLRDLLQRAVETTSGPPSGPTS